MHKLPAASAAQDRVPKNMPEHTLNPELGVPMCILPKAWSIVHGLASRTKV